MSKPCMLACRLDAGSFHSSSPLQLSENTEVDFLEYREAVLDGLIHRLIRPKDLACMR
jgi:hypothetical protein